MEEFKRTQLGTERKTLSTIGDLGGEFGLIERIAELLTPPGAEVLGIGDDCAALPLSLLGAASDRLLLTTDTLVEGRHFRKSFTQPKDLGWKLLAVSLSDIAAMGGAPKLALLSFQLPATTELEWVEELVRGAQAAATTFGLSIVGGNCSSAESCSLTSTVIGSTACPIARSGAEPGDDLWVSGTIGLASLGLRILDGVLKPGSAEAERCISAYCTPIPRVLLGRFLAEKKLAHAMIDISDGLVQDAAHLAAASGMTLVIDLPQLETATAANDNELALLELIVGGDDYELLFTAPVSARSILEQYADPPYGPRDSCGLTRIGSVVAEPKAQVLLRDKQGVLKQAGDLLRVKGVLYRGYDHFR